MKRVAIVQSNYIPWKGYFDLIGAVDEFVLFDDVQFTRRDWRNRNLVKTPNGVNWLTVPVKVKGRFSQSIRDTEIDGDKWRVTHWATIEKNYRRAPFFDDVASLLQPLFLDIRHSFLSEMNKLFLEKVSAYLGIKTSISNSSKFQLDAGKSQKLLSICSQAGATEYISGPSARAYLDEGVFQQAGIKVTWFDYDGYRCYPQLWGDFVHQVSIIDLLFNCGPGAPDFMHFKNNY